MTGRHSSTGGGGLHRAPLTPKRRSVPVTAQEIPVVPPGQQGEEPPRPQDKGPRKNQLWSGRSTAVSALVLLSAGILFGVSASNADQGQSPTEIDLVGVVGTQQEKLAALNDQVDGLKHERDMLLQEASGGVEAASASMAIRGAVTGPGLIVTLDDAPLEFSIDGDVNVNETIVHQQDVDAVMNALWRGGAEFMSVQDERITAQTPVRCIGNVILVGSRSYAPPYEIAAIGDVQRMLNALEADPTLILYRDMAARYNLGWNVTVVDQLDVPSAYEPAAVQFVRETRTLEGPN